ncbi:hypothetical protein ACET3Z_031318 [Daucus carota]
MTGNSRSGHRARATAAAASSVALLAYFLCKLYNSNYSSASSSSKNKLKNGLIEAIGNTPLIRINSLSHATGCQILGKVEFLNPGGSIEDRVAVKIIQETSFSEPRLLILTDPRTDHQLIKEAALGNILTIAFCDTDSPMRYVDIGPKWEVMVDLFFYREPEEAKEEEEEAALADYADYSAPALGGTDHWSSQFPDAQWKNEGVQAAIPDVPGATGWTADAGENLKFH